MNRRNKQINKSYNQNLKRYKYRLFYTPINFVKQLIKIPMIIFGSDHYLKFRYSIVEIPTDPEDLKKYLSKLNNIEFIVYGKKEDGSIEDISTFERLRKYKRLVYIVTK